MARIIEIRSYTLQPGGGDAFHRLMQDISLPMLRRRGVDIVATGPSIDDRDRYFLIRAYDDLAHLQSSQDAFYGSAEWREGPREPVLALIQSYQSIVLPLDAAAIDTLRGLSPSVQVDRVSLARALPPGPAAR